MAGVRFRVEPGEGGYLKRVSGFRLRVSSLKCLFSTHPGQFLTPILSGESGNHASKGSVLSLSKWGEFTIGFTEIGGRIKFIIQSCKDRHDV